MYDLLVEQSYPVHILASRAIDRQFRRQGWRLILWNHRDNAEGKTLKNHDELEK